MAQLWMISYGLPPLNSLISSPNDMKVVLSSSGSWVISAPDPYQPQRGLLPVTRILEAIRAGVGVGLGPRLGFELFATMILQFEFAGDRLSPLE